MSLRGNYEELRRAVRLEARKRAQSWRWARPVRLRDAVVIVALSVLMAAAAAAAVLLASGWMGAGQAQWRALRLDGLPVSGGEASGELRWSHGLRGWRHFFAVERCGHLAYMTWQHGARKDTRQERGAFGAQALLVLQAAPLLLLGSLCALLGGAAARVATVLLLLLRTAATRSGLSSAAAWAWAGWGLMTAGHRQPLWRALASLWQQWRRWHMLAGRDSGGRISIRVYSQRVWWAALGHVHRTVPALAWDALVLGLGAGAAVAGAVAWAGARVELELPWHLAWVRMVAGELLQPSLHTLLSAHVSRLFNDTRAWPSSGANAAAVVWHVGMCPAVFQAVVGMLWCRWRRPRRRSGRMQVFVRTLSGKTGVVSVLPCDPAAVLLLSTAANEGVPPVLLRLLWRSRRVRLHRSFAAQGILPGSTVFVTSVLYGGVGFTEAEVRRVCDAVEKLARRDAGACARMEAGQWEPLVQVLAHQSTASPAVVEAVLRERAATIRAAVAVAGITHRMFAARTAKQQAARAAAAGSVAGSVQASAGGAPGTSAVGASPAAGTGPGSAGAAASRYSGAAGAPSAAQHKVIAAPGARLASVPQQPRTVRQRAQAEAFKSMMGQGLDEGSRAHAAAQTCTFTRPEPPAPPAPAAREGQPQGRYVTDVIDGIVGVLRQHRDLASILHRKEMNMLLPGELKQLAEALQQQLPEKLRSSSVHGMETWLHHHVDEIELALAGVPNPDAVAAAAGVGGAAMPWEVQLGLQRVAEMMGLASDAEKQPAAEAWQERQWHTLTDCISATRAAARVAGDTAGAAGAAVSTGGAQTAAGGVPDIATSRLCDDAAAAQAMRQQMAAELPTQPCCVCGRRRRQRDVHWHRVSGLREWLDEQLSVMLPGTAEAPRDGNTLWAPPTSAEAVALLAGATGAASMPEITERVMREGPASGRTVYRLQAHPAAGTVQLAADGDHQLRVCVDCMRAHQHGHLPPLSYACVDNGLRPSHLPQLTVMEERLVAVWRPLRNLMVCRPPAAGGGPGHWEMRAHVIAFKAPEPQQLAAVFPCSLARVPECITVVFVSPAQTYQQLEALARRVPALMVRGKVVAAWARHLAALYPSARLDEAAVQEWERQPPTAVADTLARRAVCTQTQGEASALLRTLRAEQEGYARARYGTAEEAAARGASTAMAVAVNSDSSSGSDSEAIIVQQSLARPSRKRSRLLSAAHMQRLLCGLDRDASVAVRQLLLAHNFKAAATKLLRHHGGAPTKEAVTQMQVQLQTQHCNYEQVLTDHERALIAEANASGSTRPLSRPPAGAPLPPGSLFVVHEPQALSPVQREHGGRRPQSLPALPAEAAQRAGAAAPAAAAAGAEVAAAFSSCGQNVTHMQGIDDVDLSPTPADSPALRAVFEDACADERALQLLLDGWPLASCTEQAPQSDYQPEWPLRVHVNRFPNGTGACPAGMQMLSWIQLQLQRWYPPAPDGTEDCSAQAPHFILDMFDAWQRHTVNQQVAVRFKLDPQLIMSLGDMGPDTLVEAADVLAAGLSRAEQAQRLHGSPPEVEQLVRGARITGAHVVGSPGSYAALRSRAYGLWAAYGPPSATVTLNPASVHSDATFTLMGRPYTFDVRTGAPQHRPMAAERWDLVAGHPLACAESFEAFMDAFCDVFLGWPAGSDVQQRSNCLFGRVDAFFFKFEMNQRGELHVHGCIWQPGLQPARLRKALADPRNCPDVLDFLESVQTQWFASPLLFSGGERPVHAQKLSTEQLQEVAEAAGSERLTELQRDILREVLVEVKARGAMEDAAVSCRPPLQCSSLTEAERLGLFAAHAVLETLLHAHRDGTCTTSHSKHATDSNCRMRLPRMLHWLTTYLHEQSVCVHLKRYGRYMVSHMVALLLAVPCNHTVTFACDVGRWLRTRELWDQRHEGIPRTDPVWERRPQLPSLEQLAADAADYALKYATKSEAVQGSRALIAAATMLRRRMHLMTPEQQAGIESEHLPIQDVLDQLRHPFAAFADASASAWAPRPPTAGVSAAGESSTPAQAQFTAEVTARAQQSATVAALRTARPVGAAAVQREGMFNLAHAINLLTAQQTFSAPAAALLLMRGTDAHESHQFRAIDYRMFSQHVQSQLKRADPELRPRDTQLRLVCTMGSVGAGGSPTGEGQLPAASTIASDVPDPGPSGSVQQLEQPAVAPARYRSSSYLKDYLYRGEALRELSPMMMAMLFYKHSAGPDGAQGHHLRLHPAHPEYSKCVWRRRLRPYVPQPVCDPVVRPADGVGDPQVLERYAVFALANFAAYSCDDMLDLSNGAWAAYQRCFAQPADGQSLHVRIACRMLDHVDGLARVRMRAEERRQLQAEAEGTAEDVAEEALLEGVPLEGMDDLEAEPQDDEEPDVRRSAAPAAELWQGCALSETERAGLLQRIVHGGLGGGLTTEATTVVAQIPRANAWPAVGRTAAAAVVRSTQEWTHERLAAAQQRMHDYDLGGQYAAQALAQAQGAVQQQLLLYNSGTAAVTAKLVLISPLAVTTAAPEVQGVWPDAANPGAEPPYVLCPEDSQPTPEDTARLWNLSDDQQQAFMLYAQLLLAEAAGVRQPPVCSVLTGKAGSGKSRVLQALLWFAYQHRCESLIALVSYTWRAALHDSTPGVLGTSTTSFFATAGTFGPPHRDRVERNLNGVRFIFLDEFSTCGLSHWARICMHVHAARRHVGIDSTHLYHGPLSDLHGLLVGDLRQLPQPRHVPLYSGAAEESLRQLLAPGAGDGGAMERQIRQLEHPEGSMNLMGRELWNMVPFAFVLTHQHRQQAGVGDNNEPLFMLAEKFGGVQEISQADLDTACQQLNARVWQPPKPGIDPVPQPFAVVQRHVVRVPLALQLVQLHALAQRQQLLLWRSADLSPDGSSLPISHVHQLEALGGAEDDSGVPAVCAFFAGIRYVFTSNEHVRLYHINNNSATGTGIVLHPNESPLPDASIAPVHVLKFVPSAVMVRPDGPDAGRVSVDQALDVGEIPVLPCSAMFTSQHATLRLPVMRWGFRVELAYAVTDYFAQGQTLPAHELWLVDMCKPQHGSWRRASIYVMLTRFRGLHALHLVRPLWASRAEERRLKKALRTMLTPEADLAAEWQRLLRLSQSTAVAVPGMIVRIQASMAAS